MYGHSSAARLAQQSGGGVDEHAGGGKIIQGAAGRVADQPIQPPLDGLDSEHQAGNLALVRKVANDAAHARDGDTLNIREQDGITGPVQLPGDLGAQPLGAAGDEIDTHYVLLPAMLVPLPPLQAAVL